MLSLTSRIVALDRVHDGLFLYFSDGSSGFFPDTLLHEMLERATPIGSLLFGQGGGDDEGEDSWDRHSS